MSEVQMFATPEGVAVNQSLFKLDTYTDDKGRAGKPNYKVELAVEDNEDLAALEEAVYAAAVEKWGPDAETKLDNGAIRSPFLDGDQLAAARESRGKTGDAYKGKVVIRASSIYDKHGTEGGEGGIVVVKEDGETEVVFAERDKLIYNGVKGVAAVTINCYDGIGGGIPGVKFYLSGFQRTGDGERLGGERSFKGVFKPVSTSGSTTGRRRKAA